MATSITTLLTCDVDECEDYWTRIGMTEDEVRADAAQHKGWTVNAEYGDLCKLHSDAEALYPEIKAALR